MSRLIRSGSCCGDSSSNSKGYNNRVVGPPIGGGSNGVRDEPTPTEKLALPPSGNGSMQPEMKTVSDSVPADTGGLAVGIDFGTTFSGVSFASLKHFGDDTRMVLSWPGCATLVAEWGSGNVLTSLRNQDRGAFSKDPYLHHIPPSYSARPG